MKPGRLKPPQIRSQSVERHAIDRRLSDLGDAIVTQPGQCSAYRVSSPHRGPAVMSEQTVEAPLDLPACAGFPPLLEFKFAVPAPPRFVVSRPRLWNQLSVSLREPVAVVTGPAGSGKTELVASWIRAGSLTDTVVWVNLEDGDGTPAVFWTYVVEGLRRAGLPLFRGGQQVPAGEVDRTFLVRLAAELASQAQPVVLVLDGVSNLIDQRWADDLDFLLRHAGQRLRLVFIGRWEPPLPLYRYRLVGRLGEVRGEDLAFTPDETADLLAVHGVELSERALAGLVRHTEGWAAGSRLVAMALAGHGGARRSAHRARRRPAHAGGAGAGEHVPGAGGQPAGRLPVPPAAARPVARPAGRRATGPGRAAAPPRGRLVRGAGADRRRGTPLHRGR